MTLYHSSRNNIDDVDAHFNEANQLHHLPGDYKNYRITFLNPVDVTAGDIEAIFTWQSAKDIKVFDNSRKNDVASMLWQRADQFQTSNLQSLSLTLQSGSIQQIDVAQFFDDVKSLQSLFLHATIDINIDQMMQFAEQIGANKDLKVETGTEHIVIVKRKSKFDRVIGAFSKLFGK